MKTILITGCSSGIGYYCAHELKNAGYRVVASARKNEDVTRLKNEGLDCVQIDLADENSILSGFSETLEITGGKIDVLFNNGAYGQPGAVEDLPTSALRAQFETNLFGWHTLTNEVIKLMRVQGHGRIIQNSSVLGLIAMPYRGAYNASKFALEGLTDTLRQELTGSGIEVSLIEPGPIKSKFRHNALAAFINSGIDIEASVHKENYLKQRQRLEAQNAPQPFTLEPDAVHKCLLHAIESKRPKARYYVTFPTHLFGFLRRVLSTRLLDRMLLKSR